MNTRVKLSCLALVSVLFSLAPPVVAADEFADACKLYEKREYAKALPALEGTAVKFPTYWPGHYYLAHTYLALGHRLKARHEYESCLGCKPAPSTDVSSTCQKMITSLGGTVPAIASEPVDTVAKDALAPPKDGEKAGEGVIGAKVEKAEAGPTAIEKDKLWRKKSIQEMCDRQVATLRQELKDRIAQAELDSNHWAKPSPWECPQTHLPEEERAAITKEYDEKIMALQERARVQIDALK